MPDNFKFLVSKTKDVVTPESAENSDVDHGLSGFVYEDMTLDLRALKYEVNQEFFALEHVYIVSSHKPFGQATFYSQSEDIDFVSGHSSTYGLHVDFLSHAARRAFMKVFKKK